MTIMASKFLSPPSARRATSQLCRPAPADRISIPALREEGDNLLHEWYHGGANFYPRPPRGGRLRILNNFNNVELFLSPPSARRATGRRGRR